MTGERGFLRRAFSRLATSDHELEAAQLQGDCVAAGAVLVAELPERERARVSGTLRAVTLRPRAGVPALEAELYDGSGTIALVWLGRRAIPGIEPGRSLMAHGFVTRAAGSPTMFNPLYELRPVGAE
jgi:hypothetical protein